MTIFNIGSILFYLLVSALIRKNRYRLFVWLSGIEVLAHMSAATICVGLGGNFQLSLLGMLLFFFITECFIQNKRRNTISLLSIDILYSIALIALYSICYRMETERFSFHYTVTIGAGKYQNGQSSKEWIAFVDKQLYVGKCTGKNKVVC